MTEPSFTKLAADLAAVWGSLTGDLHGDPAVRYSDHR